MQCLLRHDDPRLDAWMPRLDGPDRGDLAALVGAIASTNDALAAMLEDLGYRVLTFTSPRLAASVLCGTPLRVVVAAQPIGGDDAARLWAATRGRWGRPGRVAVTDRPERMSRHERELYDAIACDPVCATDFAGAVHRAIARAARTRRPAPARLE